jgi:hypothetical protein
LSTEFASYEPPHWKDSESPQVLQALVFAEGGLAKRDAVGRIVREKKSKVQSLTPRSDPKI